MSVASTLIGLSQVNLATLAPQLAVDPFVAAFPTFSHLASAGRTVIPDVIAVLRKSAASTPTARKFGTDNLTAWDAADVPAVLRALNPLPPGSGHGFPTFVLGRSGSKHYMSVVTIRSGFTEVRIPLATNGFQDLANAEAIFAATHEFAVAQGFVAALPTFQIIPASAGSPAVMIALGFSSTAAAISPAITPGAGVRRWTFRSLAARNDGGLALVATGASPIPVLFNGFDRGVGQFRPTVPDLTSIDPDPGGANLAPEDIATQISAVNNGTTVDVLFAGPALIHASRPVGSPTAFTTETISGVTSPGPTGFIGFYNQIVRSPATNALHAFAYLSAPPGIDLAGPGPFDQATCFNLMHFHHTSAGWTTRVVDGDSTDNGHVKTDMGQTMSAAFEPDGTMHVFYPSSTTSTIGHRLRHARFDGTAWIAETLDGAGGPPPARAGTGRISAAVGTSPSAAFFDGAIWVVYQDSTNGNLRYAHGLRPGPQAEIVWDFGLLDGNARRGSTGGVVQTAAVVVWGTTLSVLYADTTAGLVRHAFRGEGDSAWHIELLDGAGGPDGRVTARTGGQICAVAGGRSAAGRPDLPLFVAYLMDDPADPTRQVRLATLA